MLKREFIEIDYWTYVIEDIKLIDYELWAVIKEGNEGYSCERVLAFGKVIESPYVGKSRYESNSNERVISWKPLIGCDNTLEVIDLTHSECDCELFRHRPSQAEIEEVFSSKSESGLRNKENYFWVDGKNPKVKEDLNEKITKDN